MIRYRFAVVALLLAGLTAFTGTRMLLFAQQSSTPALPPVQSGVPPISQNTPVPAATASAMDAGIRLVTDEYVKAFNNRDAKAAAALWTVHGVFVGIDGQEVRGREAIQQLLANDFKTFPKDHMEIRLISVRPLGVHTALVEGMITLTNPTEAEPTNTQYSALEVLEDGVWRTASVREWIPNPQRAASRRLLEYLLGDWKAKGPGGDFTIKYTWDESKTYLLGKYTLMRNGALVSSGTEMFSLNPNGGGLRSWTFDNSGAYSSGVWRREGSIWIDEATGILADGMNIETENVLTPLGQNAFSWQTPTRFSDQIELSPLPPIQFTRITANR